MARDLSTTLSYFAQDDSALLVLIVKAKMLEYLVPLPVLLPLLAAPICASLPRAKISWFFTAVVIWLSFVVSLTLLVTVLQEGTLRYTLGNWPAPIGIQYSIDVLTGFMLTLVSGLASVTLVFALRSVERNVEKERRPLFYTAFLLCIAGFQGMVITHDIFNLYVFLEIASIATYTLIAMGKDRRSLVASFEYLILGTIGATFILAGIGLLYMMTGTLNMGDLAERLKTVESLLPVKVAFAFLFAGLALKIAVFPLHMWLVNAYTYAPSFVSAFLSGVATKVGLYVLVRLIYTVFGSELIFGELGAGTIFIALAVLAIIVGSITPLFQNDMKRMLAFSSVAQIGYILLGIGLASQAGLIASIVHWFNHALAKAGLFMVVGAVSYMSGGVKLEDFRGAGKRMPLLMAAFLILSASLVGIPGTAGFITKWYLLTATLQQGLWPIAILLVGSSLLSAVYLWRIVDIAYFRDPKGDGRKLRLEPAGTLLAPIWILSVLSLICGMVTIGTVSVAEIVVAGFFS